MVAEPAFSRLLRPDPEELARAKRDRRAVARLLRALVDDYDLELERVRRDDHSDWFDLQLPLITVVLREHHTRGDGFSFVDRLLEEATKPPSATSLS